MPEQTLLKTLEGLKIRFIEARAESLDSFADSTLERFGLSKYKQVFEPVLEAIYSSDNREKQIRKFFGIISKIQSKNSDFLENLLNTNPNPTTIGVAAYFDPSLEGKVGGFFLPDFRQIYIDPIIFNLESENTIAEILIHEAYHGGAFTNGEIQMDESITQTMTLELMQEAGFSSEFNAYSSLVQELNDIRDGKNEFFTWEELSELYTSFKVADKEEFVGDKQDKFYEFLAMLASRDIYEDGVEIFEAKNFEKKIRSTITKFLKLFPRLAKVISPDGSFIPQNEKEVSTVRFDEIFMAKISKALVKRIETNEILASEIKSKLESDIQEEHLRVLQSELEYYAQSELGRIEVHNKIMERILRKYSYLPENFPINISEVVDKFLQGYNLQNILN